MTIVAFLQCQYFDNPQKAREVYDRNPARREDLNKGFLFSGCLSGRRLQEAFGGPLCDQIVWENITTEMGGTSNSAFPHDTDHICRVIEKHKPNIIIVFGSLAKEALREWTCLELDKRQPEPLPIIIYGPHPAARHNTLREELFEMGQDLLFKQREIFGVDFYKRAPYDHSRHEQSKSASI